MINPWLNFKVSAEMIHPTDANAFHDHNSRVSENFRFLPHLAPEPWIGNTKAKLLVLLANPGATQSDVKGIKQNGADEINELSVLNLNHALTDYPHFFFDPQLAGTDGHNWYSKRFKSLIAETSVENVANKVLSCELVAYHSFSWKKPRLNPATQEYTNQLVAEAIERNAVILVGRGKADWINNVPALRSYKNYFQPASAQCSYITERNYKENYKHILASIS